MAAETNTGTTPTPQGSAPHPGGLTKKQGLRTLQRKLERMELEHLRQHALELHVRLERAEAELMISLLTDASASTRAAS